MSRSDDTATRLLQELASLELPADSPRRSATRRETAVARMRWLIKEDRHGLANRWVVGLAAAAAILVMIFGAWRAWPARADSVPSATRAPAGSLLARGDGTELIRDGRTQTVQASATATLQPADVLQTGARSTASVATAHGVAVDLQAATRIRFEPTTAGPGDEHLALMFGRILVDVPEDGQRREFTVQTPQATVVVHGTRFAVEVTRSELSGELSTSVRVERGRVGVRTRAGETLLGAGSTWTSERGAPSGASQGPAPATSPRPTASPAVNERSAAASPAAKSPLAESSLAEQNAIYARAMQAKQRGNDDRVVTELDGLLQRFPGSPLVPDARVERFRALQRLGRTEEAARSARQYLAEQPDGFAREEARDVALGRSAAEGDEQ